MYRHTETQMHLRPIKLKMHLAIIEVDLYYYTVNLLNLVYKNLDQLCRSYMHQQREEELRTHEHNTSLPLKQTTELSFTPIIAPAEKIVTTFSSFYTHARMYTHTHTHTHTQVHTPLLYS